MRTRASLAATRAKASNIFAPHVEIDLVAWSAVERDFERAEASSRKDGSAGILRACSRDNADISCSP